MHTRGSPPGTTLAALLVACALALPVAAQTAAPAAGAEAAAELHELRAREHIRELLHAYGRLIDQRRFDEFATLFTDDAEYVGGPGGDSIVGGTAIAGFLRDIIAENPSGLPEPNFHIFFNEHIAVDGERATGTSMSSFVVPGDDGRPVMTILARYEDEYVLSDGAWKFNRRVVHGEIPAPRRGN